MSVAIDIIGDDEKKQVVDACCRDPIKFCKTFLLDHFYKEIPWVHRGLFAILLEKTEFLLDYGDISKIMRNFVHRYKDEELPDRQIFHVFINNVEVTADEHGV